jgi:hypothetical protein
MIAQGLPQFRNTVRQHAVAHHGLRPYRGKQCVFRHELAGMRHQVLQHLAGFARQREHARAPAQLGVVRLKNIGTKYKCLIFPHFIPSRGFEKSERNL